MLSPLYKMIIGIMGGIILSIGFACYFLYKERTTLIENAAKFEMAAKENEKTIKVLQENALKIATANINLSSALADAELQASIENDKLLTVDLSKDALLNPDELEKRINDEYSKSNRDLERISGHK